MPRTNRDTEGYCSVNRPAIDFDSEAEARTLYSEVVRTANYFLHNCKHFSVQVLQDENPTYAEVAEIMKQAAGIIKILADDCDPMLCQQAHEYCELMTNMGIAIETGDELRLSTLVSELERKPGL